VVREVWTYKDGNVDGYFIAYDENGKLYSEMMYKNDILEGPVYIYYPNGQVREHYYNKNGKKHGILKIYREDGTIASETNYKNGVAEGESKFYYENGKLHKKYNQKSKGNKQNDRNGQDEQGELVNGSYEEYFEFGGIYIRAGFKNGFPHGVYRKYYPSGKMLTFEIFNKGHRLFGIFFDDKGKIALVCVGRSCEAWEEGPEIRFKKRE